MTVTEFWRDMEARFRALQSNKEPVAGVPWHDDSLFAVWIATAWNEMGDHWRLDGGNPQINVKFQWLAERAAVEVGHLGGQSAVSFWLDLLKHDSPNYRATGSGSRDNNLTRVEHGKIDRVCEASADYCLRLETKERIRRSGTVPSSIPKTAHNLTDAQQQRVVSAERELKEALVAHEKMRELVDPHEWQRVAPSPNSRTMEGEIRKLERDIEKYAIEVLSVLAEASWPLGSVELFRARIENDARAIVQWALGDVNKRDLHLLDTAAIERTVADETSNWIVKAGREFPPPWKESPASLTEPAPNAEAHRPTVAVQTAGLPQDGPIDPAVGNAGAELHQANESASVLRAQETRGPMDSRKGKKPVRRNQKYKVIDEALQKIADSRPGTQEAVFQSLDARHVVIPPAEPFMTARGWIAGFRRDAAAARAWLSKRWTELNLSPLPRGPKNRKK